MLSDSVLQFLLTFLPDGRRAPWQKVGALLTAVVSSLNRWRRHRPGAYLRKEFILQFSVIDW